MHDKSNRIVRSINPFLALNILHILNDGLLASLPLLLPFVQGDLGIEFSKIGILTSILGLSAVALALPATTLSRKYGGMKILFIAAVVYSLSFVLTGLSNSYIILGFSFIVASIGFGVFHPISFAVIAHMSTTKETGSRMGNFTAVGDIGRVGISAFVTILVSFINWRNTAFVYAFFSLGIISILLLFKGNMKSTLQKATVEPEKSQGLHTSVLFISAILTGFIDALASSTIFVFIPFLFIYRGASTAVIGSMTGAFFIGNMIGKIGLGKISDKVGHRKIFLISEVSMAILLILISAVSDTWMLAGISVLLGAVTKGTVPIINTLVATAVPDKNLMEKAFGISSLATGIAASLAPIAYGLLADTYSILTVFHASAVFALCAPIPIIVQYLYCTFARNKAA